MCTSGTNTWVSKELYSPFVVYMKATITTVSSARDLQMTGNEGKIVNYRVISVHAYILTLVMDIFLINDHNRLQFCAFLCPIQATYFRWGVVWPRNEDNSFNIIMHALPSPVCCIDVSLFPHFLALSFLQPSVLHMNICLPDSLRGGESLVNFHREIGTTCIGFLKWCYVHQY